MLTIWRMKRVFASFAHVHLSARLAISLALVVFAAIALAPAAGPQKRIRENVRIAGLNVSGLDVGRAARARCDLVRAAGQIPVRQAALAGRARQARRRAACGRRRFQGAPVRKRRKRRGAGRCRQAAGAPRIRGRARPAIRRAGSGRTAVGLNGITPAISDERWGRTVRRGAMTAAITRALRTRIRGRMPVVLRAIRPWSQVRGGLRLGHRHPAWVEPVDALQRVHRGPELRRRRRDGAIPRLRPARSASPTCRRTRGGARPTPTGQRARSRFRPAPGTRWAPAGWA